ncbi:MAG: hypothetical protein M3O34_01080 [Chloroflexota bacterium]|nr:hypothetical protein [Chloroflexota bacterium]
MSESDAPHRIRVDRATYELAPDAVVPPNPVQVGTDAEGRVLYGDPARASSRKHVFLAARPTGLVGYVRPDLPAGYGLADVLRAAFPEPLPRPAALAVLGILTARHVVLIDGTRLGGAREALAAVVATVALEPAGFAAQAARVPEWALAEALRPRHDEQAARILAAPWVRGLAAPELGYVRTIEPREIVVARTRREPLDVGERVLIRSQDNSHPDVLTRVVEVGERDVRVVQAAEGHAEGAAHGDPAYVVPTSA